MAITDYLLYRLAKVWPSPVQWRKNKYGADPATKEFATAYAWDQFDQHVAKGLAASPRGRDVLEIGCGHGGISCYLAVNGARSVVGIDLNTVDLEYGRAMAAALSKNFGVGAQLPVTFQEMDAYQLTLEPESIDLVVAENAFEHFMRPEQVLSEAYRVLRPGGKLLVPIFSSIYSKYGLHLKNGLKLPWANLFFSEKTIIKAMYRLAAQDARIYELYPGLRGKPERVRDLRPYKDLNDITYGVFKEMARRVGYQIDWFRPMPTRLGKIVQRLPWFKNSRLMDIYSVGAAALLKKPARRDETAPS